MFRHRFQLGPWTCTGFVALGIVALFLVIGWISTDGKAAIAETTSRLERRIPVIEFLDAPLEQVIKTIGDTAEVDTVVNWDDLAHEHIERSSPVTCRLRNISARKALGVCLHSAGSNPPAFSRMWSVDANGRVTIAADPPMITKEYELRDLVFLEDFEDTKFPEFEIGQGICRLLQDTVAADSWAGQGGHATCFVSNRILIVRQTPENQWHVANLMEKLRETRNQPDWYLARP